MTVVYKSGCVCQACVRDGSRGGTKRCANVRMCIRMHVCMGCIGILITLELPVVVKPVAVYVCMYYGCSIYMGVCIMGVGCRV